MNSTMQRIIHGYRARQLEELYYAMFCNRNKPYKIRYNEITGPYRLYMCLSDGPGMRKRLRDGTEMNERRVFLPLIKPGWVCVDVRAHVGDYTIEMASLVGSGGKVYSYEAIPHYYELLSKSVQLNGLVNTVVKLAVVGDAPGKLSVPDQMLTGNLATAGSPPPEAIGHQFRRWWKFRSCVLMMKSTSLMRSRLIVRDKRCSF